MTLPRFNVRHRVFGAATLVIVTGLLVSPSPKSSAEPLADSSARKELRAQIATLRGGIGLLELEHEADHSILLESLKNQDEAFEKLEAMGEELFHAADGVQLKKMFQDVTQSPKFDHEAMKVLQQQFDGAVAKNDEAAQQKAVGGLLKATLEVDKASYADEIARRKQEYASRLTRIAEKQLMLEDELARYRETR